MKNPIIIGILVLFSILVSSCKYDFILPVPEAPVAAGVSFATQVAPIFSSGDKCTSCHKSGGQSPDYTPSKAYSSIVPNLVNLSTPNQSKIYTYPNPTTSSHSWKKLTTNEAAVILQWIAEGAKNN